MNLTVIATVFPLVFIGELPDKTMFASLLLASRGRALPVWIGASLAFAVHVAIAVTVGVALFHLLPHRVVDALVAAMFLGVAIYSFAIRNQEEPPKIERGGSGLGAAATAAGVIFLAEWGDLTQILTANLAARYHDPWSVAVGALAALVAVAALAVASGVSLLRYVSVRLLRLATAVVLLGLAAYTAVEAASGP